MKRHNNFYQRPDFQKHLEDIGMNYWNLPSGPDQKPYWQEGVVYAFSETQIDKIQEATQELHDMSVEMVSSMIKSGDYPEYFALDQQSIPLIEQSWERNDPSLYGRFDVVFDGKDEIKMLEYNGDTPVSILECSVAQWNYIEQLKQLPEQYKYITGSTDLPKELNIQYNQIDETLQSFWSERFEKNSLIHFAASGDFRNEDWGNLTYVMDSAVRAGMDVKELTMQDIGFTDTNLFIDLEDYEIKNIFKLYPWEWMTSEEFGSKIIETSTKWMEPAWKMLLSNKAMLVKLWEMFPNHPYLLEAYSEQYFDANTKNGKWCKKAIHGREGANIHQVEVANDAVLKADLAQGSHFVEEYVHWGYMYQKWHNLPVHDGYRPILGSWIIGDKACGMSVREDQNLVTGNDAFFASHLFVPYDLEEKFKDLYGG